MRGRLAIKIKNDAVVGVCHGPRCGDYGGRELAENLNLKGVAFEVLDCQSLCPHAPVVRIDGVAKLKADMHLWSDIT